MVDDLHPKTMRPTTGDGLADAPHAQDAQGRAVYLGAGKQVVAPLGPAARTQEMFALGHASGRRHHQRETKIGGGFGQHVGGIGRDHLGRRHGGHVKVVVANRHVGANAQPGTGGEHAGVDGIGPGGQGPLACGQGRRPTGAGPGGVGLVGTDLERVGQLVQDLGENGAGDDDAGFHAMSCNGWGDRVLDVEGCAKIGSLFPVHSILM